MVKKSIDVAAAAWAWLLAADRSSGQEWHFDSDARNKASAWLPTTKALLETGGELLKCGDGEIESLTKQWNDNLSKLKLATGES